MRDFDKELIERYLWGDLTEDEQKSFEEKRQNDADFAALVAEEEQLRDFLKNQEARQTIVEQTTQLGQEFFPTATGGAKVRNLRRTIMTVAAAAAILTAALMAWFWVFPTTPQSLYQAYAVHETLDLSDRSSQNELEQLQADFNAGNYLDAVPGLVALMADDPGDLEAERALGVAYLESGQLEQALTIFQKMADSDSAYQGDGVWYTALTYLRMEEVDQAKEWLQKIERGTRWYASARKLARRL